MKTHLNTNSDVFHLDPGCLTFSLPRIEVNVDTGIAKIEVKRINGKDGKVGCFWNTMEISAKANQHFVDTKGITRQHNIGQAVVEITTN